jgi:opacity protein-like surface antigen
MRPRTLLIAAALTFGLAPAASAQDWFITPYVGGTFGGDATLGALHDVDDEIERRVNVGATFGWQPNVLGFEVDFGWSPNFFEDTAGDRDFELGDSNVTTLMANLLIGAPAGSAFHPYASGGFGLIRAFARAEALFADITDNDLGVNLGGGVNAMVSPRIGIRGDLRYFRSLQDEEPGEDFDLAFGDFDFWRVSAGVTFRW